MGLNKMENIKEDVMKGIVKTYGNRLNLTSIKKDNENYLLNFDYSRPFQIFNEETNTIYIRSVNISNIYQLEISSIKDISLPVNEINEEIKNYFGKLQQEISKEILLNKNLIMQLLNKNHNFTQILSKLSKLLIRTIEHNEISIQYKNNLVKKEAVYNEYFKLLIKTNLIEENDNKYSTTAKFNKIIEKGKKTNSIRLSKDELLYTILLEHYDYLVNEMGLNTIKTYINVLSVFYYLEKYQGLSEISLGRNGIYQAYVTLFRKKDNKDFFEDRIDELKESSIVTQSLHLNTSLFSSLV